MISNYQIAKGSTLPWLEVQITKDGRVSLYGQAANLGCPQETADPNAVDLSDVWKIEFKMFKCGRVPAEFATSGVAEVVDAANGIVRYKWSIVDTENACSGCIYYGQFIITFIDGSLLKWPFQLESMAIEIL